MATAPARIHSFARIHRVRQHHDQLLRCGDRPCRRAAGNVSLKSGTNQLDGSLFEYHNSNATKAKPYVLPAGERKPKAIFDQMGGTVGGPIVKQKLFFFGSYEGTYDRQFASRIETIPNAPIRRGDMSASPTLIYDPDTGAVNGTGRTPFPLNQIPANRMEPIALKIQSMLPNPTFDSLTANLFAQGKYQFNWAWLLYNDGQAAVE